MVGVVVPRSHSPACSWGSIGVISTRKIHYLSRLFRVWQDGLYGSGGGGLYMNMINVTSGVFHMIQNIELWPRPNMSIIHKVIVKWHPSTLFIIWEQRHCCMHQHISAHQPYYQDPSATSVSSPNRTPNYPPYHMTSSSGIPGSTRGSKSQLILTKDCLKSDSSIFPTSRNV